MVRAELNRIRQQAAEWVVSLQDADTDEHARLQAECDAWQAADPRHRQVLSQMQQLWQATEPAKAQRRKRRLAGLGAALLMICLSSQLPWSYWGADYRTARGEIRSLTLPDGSQIVLNSNSAIDLDYTDRGRTLTLLRGELLATVATDPQRPFRVQTDHVTATALGTRYSVELTDSHSRVAVQESSVTVTPRQGEQTLTLTAGQRADINRTHLIARSSTPTYRPDWADKRLVFNNAPLQQVVERLATHRTGILALDDSLAHLQRHFTGVLPADDSETALSLLSDTLDLQVERFTPWYVMLSPRQKK